MRRQLAERIGPYDSSVFEEMSALAQRCDAIDLGSGTPDLQPPAIVIEAAAEAIRAGRSQYSPVSGEPLLKQAIARHSARFCGEQLDPATEITVTCGVTEGMQAAMLAFVQPGDEVVVLEPFYESYVPAIRFAGGVPVGVALEAPSFDLDPARLAAAFSGRTKALILNNPHNPSGKVFQRAELAAIADLCLRYDALAITDEVYEHIVFDGRQHRRLATLPGMRERTLTLSGASKTFSCTGWRIGWATGPAPLQEAINKARQFTVFCAPTPLQLAIARGLDMDDCYFEDLAAEYQARRDVLLNALQRTSFETTRPAGSCFVVSRINTDRFANARECCQLMAREIGVAAIPLHTFFLESDRASDLIRFTYCQRREKLLEAARRLLSKGSVAAP